MLFYKSFIKQCIRKHSKELEHGAKMVMKAQKLKEERKFKEAIKYYTIAKEMFEKAEILASFIGDKDYELEAKILIKRVEEEINTPIIKGAYIY